MRYVPLLFLIIILAACNGGTADHRPEPAHVVPLYKEIAGGNISATDSTELKAFMLTVSDLPLSPELIEAWSASKVVAVFTPDVDSVFTDTMYVAGRLGEILHRAIDKRLPLPHRRYATVVYGRPESILFVDSVMLIALNHYLGADYPGYSHWPSYMRQTKTIQSLPYDMAEALVATSYPYTLEGEDDTALARMIYHGVLATIRQQLVPGSNRADALGYTPEQLKWLEDNERNLWHSLIGQQLLYDTSSATIDKLVSPSPSTGILSPDAPGRAGRYIGYRIVCAYINKYPDTTISEMLSPDFYRGNRTLIDSQYQGQGSR